MANILTAQVTIRGTKPLIWHWFGPDSIPLEKQERTGVAGNDPEEWKKTVLATPEGQLYVTGDYAFGSIRDGARHTKKGKGSIQKNVASTLQIVERKLLVDRYLPDGLNSLPTEDTAPVYLDIRSVRNPQTKARNVRYRVASSPGWKLTFTIQWDKTIVSRGEMEAAIIDAGKLAGIGDGRNIGNGRFELEAFQILDGDAKAQAS